MGQSVKIILFATIVEGRAHMASDDFNLSDLLPYRLSVLAAHMSKKLSKVYGHTYGLTTPEWRVLAHVAHREKMSVREIHDSVSLDKPSVSRAVSKLKKAGLLAKSISVRDHRLVEIEITDKGLESFRRIAPEALAFEAAVLKAFSAEEVKQLDYLLTPAEGCCGRAGRLGLNDR